MVALPRNTLIALAVLLLLSVGAVAWTVLDSVANAPVLDRADRNAELTVRFAAREKCARDVTEQFFFDPVKQFVASLDQPPTAENLRLRAEAIRVMQDSDGVTEIIDRVCPKVPSVKALTTD